MMICAIGITHTDLLFIKINPNSNTAQPYPHNKPQNITPEKQEKKEHQANKTQQTPYKKTKNKKNKKTKNKNKNINKNQRQSKNNNNI
ncbi:hypothetical protein CKT65_004222 [Escherichia coli]|uniref:hypothetical protein n=1 Tax=Escherichia coli TaxID=562 RepID=UPI0012FFFA16|nr:hypothetical protein [Escherichia coli]EFC7554448.1 hypothetical protein [Escherichia coli]EFE0732891.1 hypothetical protein [Escherichia coli]EFG1330157.1 hypothetical protein [Escherichia coli]EFJ1844131.1 hypothetical protein [Escherichia coli]EFJ6731008.1 hypothetical protein [Escherichia coli]